MTGFLAARIFDGFLCLALVVFVYWSAVDERED